MDAATTAEVNRIVDAVEKMALNHFSDRDLVGQPFETNISFGDDQPARARLIGEELQIRLREKFASSRVRVDLVATNYAVKIIRG
ncbi:hypothetical protein [Pseudomonas costantinii]|uniref:Uncharacterized protein n=1 Tax=Pseudomonas costantinii TaxID=168469 RepID=A0A1S2UIF7_9PSED|nr:hypothetical protein [Pseudomonas costantinii]OIN45999.1 hypothetical protein BFL40_27575 [Pseudomonas costantinii]SEE53876.1 hypothetical protein SAMN04515675_6114 [Pseudomonas costantinii]